MVLPESDIRPRSREKSAYNLIFNLSETLKQPRSQGIRIDLINQYYQDWAEALVVDSKGIVARPVPLNENLEKSLFTVCCEQLRILGTSVSRREEDSAFHQFLGY